MSSDGRMCTAWIRRSGAPRSRTSSWFIISSNLSPNDASPASRIRLIRCMRCEVVLGVIEQQRVERLAGEEQRLGVRLGRARAAISFGSRRDVAQRDQQQAIGAEPDRRRHRRVLAQAAVGEVLVADLHRREQHRDRGRRQHVARADPRRAMAHERIAAPLARHRLGARQEHDRVAGADVRRRHRDRVEVTPAQAALDPAPRDRRAARTARGRWCRAGRRSGSCRATAAADRRRAACLAARSTSRALAG